MKIATYNLTIDKDICGEYYIFIDESTKYEDDAILCCETICKLMNRKKPPRNISITLYNVKAKNRIMISYEHDLEFGNICINNQPLTFYPPAFEILCDHLDKHKIIYASIKEIK